MKPGSVIKINTFSLTLFLSGYFIKATEKLRQPHSMVVKTRKRHVLCSPRDGSWSAEQEIQPTSTSVWTRWQGLERDHKWSKQIPWLTDWAPALAVRNVSNAMFNLFHSSSRVFLFCPLKAQECCCLRFGGLTWGKGHASLVLSACQKDLAISQWRSNYKVRLRWSKNVFFPLICPAGVLALYIHTYISHILYPSVKVKEKFICLY